MAWERERLELDDGDFVDLDWNGPAGKPVSGPLVLLLHGLEGSIESPYALELMARAADRGWPAVLLNFRGCSGEVNRLTRGYHAGETGDLSTVLEYLGQQHPGVKVAAVGYSLGGNVLLKYLGERGRDSALVTAVGVSVPFELQMASDALNEGLSRMYRIWLMKRMRATVRRKFRPDTDVLDWYSAMAAKTFNQFDDRVTARLHGFNGVADYYSTSSCRQFLRDIQTPTLIIHASDDPFMNSSVIPGNDELSPSVELELSPDGGHVGFVTGGWPWRPRTWLPARILDHIAEHM